MKVSKLLGGSPQYLVLGVIIITTMLMILFSSQGWGGMTGTDVEPFADADDTGKVGKILTEPAAIYDTFYVPFYKQLFQPDYRVEFEANTIKDRVLPRISDGGDEGGIEILDVAGGNGMTAKALTEIAGRDTNITILDRSKAMLGDAKRIFKDEANYIHDDMLNPSAAEAGRYDLATLLYFSVQYVSDKGRLFENIYRWLKPGGILVVHVVDRERFDPIADPASPFPMFSVQKYSKERVRDFEAKFNNQMQRFQMDPRNEAEYVIRETFQPTRKGQTARKNEHSLQMPTHSYIHGLIEQSGFKLVDKVNMTKCQHEYQYLLVQMKKGA